MCQCRLPYESSSPASRPALVLAHSYGPQSISNGDKASHTMVERSRKGSGVSSGVGVGKSCCAEQYAQDRGGISGTCSKSNNLGVIGRGFKQPHDLHSPQLLYRHQLSMSVASLVRFAGGRSVSLSINRPRLTFSRSPKAFLEVALSSRALLR